MIKREIAKDQNHVYKTESLYNYNKDQNRIPMLKLRVIFVKKVEYSSYCFRGSKFFMKKAKVSSFHLKRRRRIY